MPEQRVSGDLNCVCARAAMATARDGDSSKKKIRHVNTQKSAASKLIGSSSHYQTAFDDTKMNFILCTIFAEGASDMESFEKREVNVTLLMFRGNSRWTHECTER